MRVLVSLRPTPGHGLPSGGARITGWHVGIWAAAPHCGLSGRPVSRRMMRSFTGRRLGTDRRGESRLHPRSF
jgi:hypothetical protein